MPWWWLEGKQELRGPVDADTIVRKSCIIAGCYEFY